MRERREVYVVSRVERYGYSSKKTHYEVLAVFEDRHDAMTYVEVDAASWYDKPYGSFKWDGNAYKGDHPKVKNYHIEFRVTKAQLHAKGDLETVKKIIKSSKELHENNSEIEESGGDI